MSAGGKTLLRTNAGRVFESWKLRRGKRERFVYACLFGGHRVAVGRTARWNNDFPIPIWYQISAPYLVYKRSVNGGDGFDREDLFLVDLRSGKRLRYIAYPVPDPHGTGADDAHFSSVVVAPHGSLAWVSTYCARDPTDNCTVHHYTFDLWVADASGVRLVESGDSLRALAISGSVISWTDARGAQSAALDDRAALCSPSPCALGSTEATGSFCYSQRKPVGATRGSSGDDGRPSGGDDSL